MADTTRPTPPTAPFVVPPLGTDNPLTALPLALQEWFWKHLARAAEGALDHWAATPPGSSAPPEPALRPLGHARPNSGSASLLSQETLRRKQQIEVRLTVEALEAFALAPGEALLARLTEHCTRLGICYAEIARRVDGFSAWLFLRWDLRLLRYRSSSAVAGLVGL